MSLYLHTAEGDKQMNTGVPQGLLDEVSQAQERISALQSSLNGLTASISQKEAQIAALQQKDADLTNALAGKLNADRVTRSAGITEAGWALDARELNAGMTGSLAHSVAGNAQSIRRLSETVREIDGEITIRLSDDGNDETGNPCYKTIEGSRRVWERYKEVCFEAAGSCSFTNAYICNKKITFSANGHSVNFGGNKFVNCIIDFYYRKFTIKSHSVVMGIAGIQLGGYDGFDVTLESDLFSVSNASPSRYHSASAAIFLTANRVSIEKNGYHIIRQDGNYVRPTVIAKINGNNLNPEDICSVDALQRIGTTNVYIS